MLRKKDDYMYALLSRSWNSTNAKNNQKQKKLGFQKFLKHGPSHVHDHDYIKFIMTFQ